MHTDAPLLKKKVEGVNHHHTSHHQVKLLINKQKYSAFSHKMDGQIWAVVF